MSSSNSGGLNIPAGYYPPFATVTNNDHTAWILITTALGLACVLMFSGIRLLVRKAICPGVGLDDYLIIGATVLAITEFSVTLAASSRGLGKSVELISPANQDGVQKLYYGAVLLFIISLGLSKLSVIFLLLRLTPSRTHKRVFIATAIFTSLWTIASLFALAFECDLSHPWLVLEEKCSGMLLRWQIICAFDMAIEVLITSMSIFLVARIHASFTTKAAVVAMFAPRLLMIIPISFRLVTFPQTGRTSNFTLVDSLFLVWTQAELSYSIISATIPTMRPFITTLNTHFGGIGENESMRVYSFSRESTKVSKRRDSFQLPKLLSRPSDVESKQTESISRSAINFTGSPQYYNCDVWSSNDALKDVAVERLDENAPEQVRTALTTPGNSDVDEIRPMMIRKEITYEVQHQNEES